MQENSIDLFLSYRSLIDEPHPPHLRSEVEVSVDRSAIISFSIISIFRHLLNYFRFISLQSVIHVNLTEFSLLSIACLLFFIHYVDPFLQRKS